ncbi:hypothetical protein Tco_0145816 [Tanacetum coccineum]
MFLTVVITGVELDIAFIFSARISCFSGTKHLLLPPSEFIENPAQGSKASLTLSWERISRLDYGVRASDPVVVLAVIRRWLQAKAIKDFSRPAGKLRPQDGRIGYEEFQVTMKEGTDWRKVSLGKCLLPYRSSKAYIANDTLSTLHLQRKPEESTLRCYQQLQMSEMPSVTCGQQQMPSTSTNHADASSISNPAHADDVPDSRDTSLPGQQMQSGVQRPMV